MQVQAAENAFKRPGIHMVAQQFYQEVSAAALQEVCVQEVCLQLCQEVSAACDRSAGAESTVRQLCGQLTSHQLCQEATTQRPQRRQHHTAYNDIGHAHVNADVHASTG